MAEPHELLDPDDWHQNPLYWRERWPCGCPVNNFRVNQWIVYAFPPDHAPPSRLHVTEPVGLLTKCERDHKAIHRWPCAQRRCIGATGTPPTMIHDGKHRQAGVPRERQHERIEASCADTKQSVRDAIDSPDGSRLICRSAFYRLVVRQRRIAYRTQNHSRNFAGHELLHRFIMSRHSMVLVHV